MISLLLLTQLVVPTCESILQKYTADYRSRYTHTLRATSDSLLTVMGFSETNLQEQIVMVKGTVPMVVPPSGTGYYKGTCTTTSPLATEIWGKVMRVYEIRYPNPETH